MAEGKTRMHAARLEVSFETGRRLNTYVLTLTWFCGLAVDCPSTFRSWFQHHGSSKLALIYFERYIARDKGGSWVLISPFSRHTFSRQPTNSSEVRNAFVLLNMLIMTLGFHCRSSFHQPHNQVSKANMTQWEYESDFQSDNPAVDSHATLSFMTDTSTSCPSSVASSRRSSEVSFSSSFSGITPVSPVPACLPFDDQLAPNCNPMASFPSARFPFFENEEASIDLSESLRPDECVAPSAMPYVSLIINGNTLPYELSVSGLNIYQEDVADEMTLEADLPVGSGQLIAYPKDIGAVLPDESVMTYLRAPFIIPSQTLRNNDSQGVCITDPSLASSPDIERKHIYESHQENETTAVPERYKSSDTIASSEIVSTRSVQKRFRRRNRVSGGAKIFEQNMDTRVHWLKPAMATQKKNYRCLTCAKGFDRQEHYKRHQNSDIHRKMMEESGKKVSEPPVKMYSCPKCFKKFNRHDNLRPHFKTHLLTVGRNARNKPVDIAESWKFGWEELDPRISSDEVERAKLARSRRVTGGWTGWHEQRSCNDRDEGENSYSAWYLGLDFGYITFRKGMEGRIVFIKNG